MFKLHVNLLISTWIFVHFKTAIQIGIHAGMLLIACAYNLKNTLYLNVQLNSGAIGLIFGQCPFLFIVHVNREKYEETVYL